MIHGDVRLGNVAITPTGAPAYLDFGFAAARPRIHELAYALAWIILRPDHSGRAEDYDWDLLAQLIGAYEDTRHGALSTLERQAIRVSTAAVPLYLASIAGFTPDPVRELRGLQPFISIADWLLHQRIPTDG